jgi:hypothetical protein
MPTTTRLNAVERRAGLASFWVCMVNLLRSMEQVGERRAPNMALGGRPVR